MAGRPRQDMPPPARKSATSSSHITIETPQKQSSGATPSSDLVTSSSKRRRKNRRRSHRRSSFSSSNGTSVTRTTSNTSAGVQDYPPVVYKDPSPMPSSQVPPPASFEEQQVYDKEPEQFHEYAVSDDETYQTPAKNHTRAQSPPVTFSTNVFGDDTSSSDDEKPAIEPKDEIVNDQIAEQEDTSPSESEDSAVISDAEADHSEVAEEEAAGASDDEASTGDTGVGNEDAKALEQDSTSSSDSDHVSVDNRSERATDQEEMSASENEELPSVEKIRVEDDETVEQEDVSMSDDQQSAEALNAAVGSAQPSEEEAPAADLVGASIVPVPRTGFTAVNTADASYLHNASGDQDHLLPEPKTGKLKRKRQPIQVPHTAKKRARTKLSLSPEPPTETMQNFEAQPIPESRSPEKRKKRVKTHATISPNLDPAVEFVQIAEPEPVSTKSKLARRQKISITELMEAENQPNGEPNTGAHKFAEISVNVPRKMTAAAACGSASGSKSTTGRKNVKQTSILDSSQPTKPRKKTIASTYTSAKGKGKAEDGVVYSSPGQSSKIRKAEPVDYNTQGDESDGLATTVARRTVRTTEDSSESYAGSGEDSAEGSPKQKSKRDRNAYNVMRSASKQQARHLAKVSAGDGRSEAYTGGLTGKFTEDEREVIFAWRDRFCSEHDITQSKFNDIMTQTMRRKKTDLWAYKHIVSKEAFMAEYYDQLPDRNRRSMNRFRERAFQNVVENKWSAEDDEELERLFEIHGPKWVEIGLEMERTQDSVHQRWRNKVQFASKIKEGDWPAEEAQRLQDAVVRWLEASPKRSHSGDPKIPWSAIARVIGGTRTARQCSNKWRNLTTRREEGEYIEVPLSDRIAINANETRTPSKMHQRLTGRRSTVKPLPGKRKSFKSNERVVDSDDDEDVFDARNKGNSDVVRAEDDRNPYHLPDRTDNESDRSEDADINGRGDERNGRYDGVEIEESSGAKEGLANSPIRSQRQRPSLFSPPPASPPNRPSRIAETSPPVSPQHGENSLPRQANPFIARTPINGLSMTQLHQGTQANTTAKRTNKSRSIGSGLDESTSQERRPSPELSLRQRPISSPLEMLGEETALPQSISGSDDEDNDLSLHTATSGNDRAMDDESGMKSADESGMKSADESGSGSGETDPESDGQTASKSSDSEEEEEDKTEQRRKGFLSSLWPFSSQRNAQRNALDEGDED